MWADLKTAGVFYWLISGNFFSLAFWTKNPSKLRDLRTELFGHTLILFHIVASWLPKLYLICRYPFDLQKCVFQRWNQIISNVLPECDKSDKEELEPAGWKTSEPGKFVGVGAVLSLPLKKKEEGYFEDWGWCEYGIFIPFPSSYTLTCVNTPSWFEPWEWANVRIEVRKGCLDLGQNPTNPCESLICSYYT